MHEGANRRRVIKPRPGGRRAMGGGVVLSGGSLADRTQVRAQRAGGPFSVWRVIRVGAVALPKGDLAPIESEPHPRVARFSAKWPLTCVRAGQFLRGNYLSRMIN